MTDTELITFLRNRITTLEMAVLDFLDVLQTTGTDRETAYNALKADNSPATLRAFMDVYEGTLEPRMQALERLSAALTQTFQEAILCDASMSEEDRTHWLRVCETESREKEPMDA